MTKLLWFTSLIISITFVICAENVERLSVRLCPSPMSHRYELFIHISASLHVTWRPHCAMIQFNITVLMATVLPPVLGPVITTPRTSPPISNCNGTDTFLSISGCLASVSFITRPVFIAGSVPSISILSFPFENI